MAVDVREENGRDGLELEAEMERLWVEHDLVRSFCLWCGAECRVQKWKQAEQQGTDGRSPRERGGTLVTAQG